MSPTTSTDGRRTSGDGRNDAQVSHRPPTRNSSPGRDRFAGRRQAERRRQDRRRLRIVVGLAIVSAVAVGVVAFVNSSWFDVDEITVTGHDRADADAIVEASGIDVGQGLLEVDLAAASQQVELVPWVGTAELRRSWNGSIEISVVERGPSVAIGAGSRFALVDDHGRQLEVVDQRPDGFLPVVGIEGSGVPGEPAPTETLAVIALIDAMPATVVDQVEAVVFDADGLGLDLVQGGRVVLGDGTELGAKIQSFETMLARVDLQCLEAIDVRVPAAPTLTRTRELPDGENDPNTDGGQEPDSNPADC